MLRQDRSPARAILVACWATACAHAPPPGPGGATASSSAPGAPAGGPADSAHVQDEAMGYAFDLPPDAAFRPGSGREGLVARAADGTELRLFVEHFARPPDDSACWGRLVERLPAEVERPATPTALRDRARDGFASKGRRLFAAPFPRESSCLVLVVDGSDASDVPRRAAALAFSTFRTRPPSAPVRARLAFEAGIQLMDAERRDAPVALARFEEALAADPAMKRAHLGAGLAAFFAGEAYTAKALEHLEIVLADRETERQAGDDALEPAQLKDALMYAGLAFAARKEFGRAEARLAEAVARFPEDAVALYNFACVLALGGEGDEAVKHLAGAFARDPALRDHARTDPDLAALRTRDDWTTLVAEPPPPARGR